MPMPATAAKTQPREVRYEVEGLVGRIFAREDSSLFSNTSTRMSYKSVLCLRVPTLTLIWRKHQAADDFCGLWGWSLHRTRGGSPCCMLLLGTRIRGTGSGYQEGVKRLWVLEHFVVLSSTSPT